MKRLCLAALLVLTTGCSTVTIAAKGSSKYSTEPTYKDRRAFWLAGIVGEHEVDVKQICSSKNAKQVQTQATFMDTFLTIVTLTIYAPRTIKVWCETEGA